VEEVVKWLKALTYLQAQCLLGTDDGLKPEVLLFRAGLSHKEIADLLGKKYMAVAKAVSRAK